MAMLVLLARRVHSSALFDYAKGLLNWWQRFHPVCCRSFPGCHSNEVVCRFDQDLRRLLHLDLRYPAAVAATVRGTIDLDMPCVACSGVTGMWPGRRQLLAAKVSR